MLFKRIYCLLALAIAFAPTAGMCDDKADVQSQIEQLNKEIKEFSDARDRYATQAYLDRDKQDQGQVQERDWLGYKEAVKAQQTNEEKVKLLDKKIAEMVKQRDDLEAKVTKMK